MLLNQKTYAYLMGIALLGLVSCSGPEENLSIAVPTETTSPATMVASPVPPTLLPTETLVQEIPPTACPFERHFEVANAPDPYVFIPEWFEAIRPNIEITCETVEDCVTLFRGITVANHEGEIVAHFKETYVPPGLDNLADANIVATLFVTQELRTEGISLLRPFIQAMTARDYFVMTRSAYRSYEVQAGLYIKEPEAAAPAGYSQHQGGLTVDLWIGDNTYNLVQPLYSAGIVVLAEQYGIVHPYSWDLPHYFLLDAVYPGATALIREQGIDPHNIEVINGFSLGVAQMIEARILALGGQCVQE